MVFSLKTSHFSTHFSSIFHVFSGTPPGSTFYPFYVDFYVKSAILEPFWEPARARNRPLGPPSSAETSRSLLDRSLDALSSFFGSLWAPFASLSPPFWDPLAPIRFPFGSLWLPERRVVLAAFIKKKSDGGNAALPRQRYSIVFNYSILVLSLNFTCF